MDAIEIALNLVPVPYLSTAFSIFRFVWSNVQAAQASKRQLVAFSNAIAKLLCTLDSEVRAGRIVVGQTSTEFLNLTRLLEEISAFITLQASHGFLKGLYLKNERVGTVDGYYKQLDVVVKAFQISALLNIQDLQRHNEEARVEDQNLLHERLSNLETNQNQLLGALEAQQSNITAMLVSLQKRIQHHDGTDREQRFFSHSLRYLSTMSGRHIQVDDWMVTSYEVEFGPQIGSGGFGQVYKGTWQGADVALKVLSTDGGGVPSSEAIRREVQNWSNLLHPHILQFLGANVLDNRPFIVMPLLENGNARDYVRTHPECDRLKIIHHISLGLVYLHSKAIVHGDLKGLNVLIDDGGKALLCDFGLSRVKADATSRTTRVGGSVVGSRNWMAPERIAGGSPKKPVDIYAFGMTIYEIYTTQIPLGHIHFNEFFDLVVNHDVRPERPEDDEAPGLSDAIWELAEACWVKDPKRRPTASATSEIVAQITKQNILSSFGSLAIHPPPPPPPPTPADSDGDRTARQIPPTSPPSVLESRLDPVSPLSPSRQVVPRDSNRTPLVRPPYSPPPILQPPAMPPPSPVRPPHSPPPIRQPPAMPPPSPVRPPYSPPPIRQPPAMPPPSPVRPPLPPLPIRQSPVSLSLPIRQSPVMPPPPPLLPPVHPPSLPLPIRQSPVMPPSPPPPPPYTAVKARYEPVQPLIPVPRVAPRELARTPRASSPASPGVTPDQDAFAEKNMPDLGHEVKEFRVFTWRLVRWKLLEKKLTSLEFECGGHTWRILLFPFGNSIAPPNDTVSLYLERAGPKSPQGWHVCAQFAIAMSNPHDPSIFTIANAHHRFIAESSDWGFTRFAELRNLFTVQPTNARPTIENDEAVITAYVRVLEDPTGVLWHDFANYDSKKETSFVGLKNQGATAYLNTELQLLYSLRAFRKAVYQIPTSDNTPTESIPLALQRVFYRLQTSDQVVGTTELTKSFGWKALDSHLAHDVLEFHCVLLDKLESKMKGTIAEGAILRLFQGKQRSYIQAINVNFVSSRVEEFHELQLNVKGMKNLYESFKDYVAVDHLEGQNKYPTERFGLQDARKGIIIESFPPVLYIQLKRFDYDIQKDAMVKLNDRHEFPFEIDLAEFLDPNTDRSIPWIYKLHAVIVHAGDLAQGHNYAIIKPDRQNRWLKFDDDRVTPVTDREVLEANYGGELLTGNRNQLPDKKSTNSAYILVYIRNSVMDEILAPIKPEDTVHLKHQIDVERLLMENKRREREEQHLFLTIKVVTDDTFTRHEGFDLATFNEENWAPTELPTFRVLKAEIYTTFKSRVAEYFGLHDFQVRFWVIVNRQNKTTRVDTLVPENDPNLTMEMVRNNMAARQYDLRLYLDMIQDPTKPEIPANSCLVFLKYFNPTKQVLHGLGKVYVSQTGRVATLFPLIIEKMRWSPLDRIKLFEEIKPGMVELMRPKLTFKDSALQDGDIVCFQHELSEIEIADYEAQGLYSSPVQFYDFLQNRVMISFRPKYSDEDPEFNLVLNKKQDYNAMTEKVARYLGHDPIKLRFTTTTTNKQPKAVLKRSLNQTIQDIMTPAYFSYTKTLILYEKLDVSIVELETKRGLKVIWVDAQNKEGASHSFLLPKTASIFDLINHLAKLVNLEPSGTHKIRIFQVSRDRRAQQELYGAEMVGNMLDSDELYAEEVPREEVEADDSDKVIHVFHFSKELSRTHGIPFRFMLIQGEGFKETKKRLQARIGVPDREFGRYRFAFTSSQNLGSPQPSYITDEDTIYDMFSPEDCLGLDHVDKSKAADRKLVIQG